MNDPNYDALEEFLRAYSADDVLTALATKLFDEAETHQKASYQTTAIELERLAEIIGNLFVPRIPTAENKEVNR